MSKKFLSVIFFYTSTATDASDKYEVWAYFGSLDFRTEYIYKDYKTKPIRLYKGTRFFESSTFYFVRAESARQTEITKDDMVMFQ